MYVKLGIGLVFEVNFKSLVMGIKGAINVNIDVKKTNSYKSLKGRFSVGVEG